MRALILDVETTISNKGNPFDQTNKLCLVGLASIDSSVEVFSIEYTDEPYKDNLNKIQKAIETMSRSKTTLIIAHRLATVVKADKIIVMEKGKIVETGSHKQLLRKKGLYSRLSELQFDDSNIL